MLVLLPLLLFSSCEHFPSSSSSLFVVSLLWRLMWRWYEPTAPQDTVLFNGSIEDNVRYGDTSRTFADAERAAELAQLLPTIQATM